MTNGTGNQINVTQLKAAGTGRWGEILPALCGIDAALLDGKHHACPKCGGTDRFRAFEDFSETGGMFCNQCFSQKNGDGIAAVQWLLGLDFATAVSRIVDYLGIAPSSNGKPKTNEKSKLKPFDEQVKWRDSTTATNEMFRTRTFEKFIQAKPGITVDAIRAAGGRLCAWPRKASEPFQCIAFPAQRTKTGDVTGWILYRADGKDFPAIPNGPDQRKTHMLRGSKDGLMIVGGWDALKEASVAVKVEGVPDALAIHSRLPADHIVITNICGCESVNLPLGAFRGKRLIVIGDTDVPGQKGAKRFASRAVANKIDDVRLAKLPFEVAADHGKDVRDFVVEGGDIAELLAESVPVERSEQSAGTTHDSGVDVETAIIMPDQQTDIANARRLVRLYGHQFRYCHPWKKSLIWDGTRHRTDNTGALQRFAKDVSDSIWREARAFESEKAIQFAAKSASEKSVKAMISLAISEPGIPVLHTDLDTNPWLLNCPNGTVDLQTGDMRPHDRNDLITKLCPTKYIPDAESYVWDRFLEGVFEGKQDLIDFMQRWCGYCLTGVVREQVLPIWYGSGANGKSTFIEAFMHAIGGDYAMKAPRDLFVAKKQDSHPTELADLFGKRFVAAVETGDGRRLNESLVKELTGGDTIRARRMREDFWEFSPTHKAIICTNHKPQVRGNDHAIWRRLWLVPFTVKFWNPDKGESGPDERHQDKMLPEKLEAEAEGILAWAVRGCLDWQLHRLSEPRDVLAATEEYRSDENITERFISECCVTGQDAYVVRAGVLYDAYKRFCEETGEYAETQRQFGSKLTEMGYERFKNNGTWYRRIAIRD